MTTTPGAGVCTWDTGSMYGCQPACDSPAQLEVTHTGYRGPYVGRFCARHARLVSARVYPDTVTSIRPVSHV